MKSLILLCAMTLFAAGCSSGGSGGGSPAPTDSVNSKITGNAPKALTGQAALFEASHALTQRQGSNSLTMSELVTNKILALDSSAEKSAVLTKTNQANRAIHSRACKIDMAQNANSNGSANSGIPQQYLPLKMKISGIGCPIEISMEMTMTGVNGANPCSPADAGMSCKFSSKMKMSYQVLDDQLANELEVRSGQLSMIFDVEQVMPNGSSDPTNVSLNMDMKNKSNFDFKAVDLQGQAHLISGNADLSVKMLMDMPSQGGQASMPQMIGGMKEDLQYLEQSSGVSSSLTALVTLNGNSGDAKYYVNGTAVTEQAYMKERDKFANSMMPKLEGSPEQSGNSQNPPTQGGSTDPFPPTSGDPGTNPFPPTSGGPGTNPFPPTSGEPNPNPFPTPPTNPTPFPEQPPAAERKWVCTVKDYAKKNIYIGYGPVEFVAGSKAKQACQQAGSKECYSTSDCEEQEANPQAWFCEAKNYSNGKIFSGTGASKTEAGFFAQKSCFSSSRDSLSSCPMSISSFDCVRQ